jgi:hypothetical protein
MGWHKMLGFFEVPSSSNGAIGPVGLGTNFDWYRKDQRPGLLNLNLVIDEEVFFGLFDDMRLNLTRADTTNNQNNTGNAQVSYNGGLPQVVTGILPGGGYAAFPASNRGFAFWQDQTTANQNNGGPLILPINKPYPNTPLDQLAGPSGAMKKAFADFLTLRHGGTGFLFAYGSGGVGSLFPAASERPFHDLTYPDIDYTVMRPANLPPPGGSTPTSNPRDPGLRYDNAAYNAPSAPPIPPRRLFQIPDTSPSPLVLPVPPGPYGNASVPGDTNYNAYSTPYTVNGTSYNLNVAPFTNDLSNAPDALLQYPNFQTNTAPFNGVSDPAIPYNAAPPATTTNNQGNTVTLATDARATPAFRIEWLNKVLNLTTVRTHQYAVWVTVGFFEVTQHGDPVKLIPDRLGPEVGVYEGKNVRYRSFFLLDRTKATGFNPADPGDFRDLILYRRRIE